MNKWIAEGLCNNYVIFGAFDSVQKTDEASEIMRKIQAESKQKTRILEKVQL